MLAHLIRLCVENRVAVVLIAAAIAIYGGYVVARLPVDVFPDLNRPTVTLLTEAGGLSPEEVEVLVTRQIEAGLTGAPGVERVRSQSGVGLSVVTVEFGWDVELPVARQQVSERLATVYDDLPAGISPTMGPVNSIMGEILLVGLVSPDGSVDGPELRKFAEVTVRPALRGIPGVSQVIGIGGGVEDLQVEVKPEALAFRGVTLAQVRDAAATAQGSTTGGFLERESQEYLVRNLARTADPDVLGDTVVLVKDGVPITLDQVADVTRGVGIMRGDAGVNGRPGVILSVQKQPGVGTIELTDAVTAKLTTLTLPEGVQVVPLFRQADFIDAAVGNVEEALRDGVILVALVLAMFLLSWRTTLVTLTALPLSFLAAALVLHGFGESINTMTLGGLAVAVGELVDDAIVDVENVWRRLRENALSAAPRPRIDVIADASSEVRGSIVYSTALVVLVFVPLFAMGGIEGRLFSPLGVAYVTAILASLGVSLTVTPALCALLLQPGAEAADGWLVRNLKRVDRAALAWVLPRPGLVLGAVAVISVAAVSSVPFLGVSFLPSFNEGTATISVIALPGTSLAESNRLGALAERLILATPEVVSTGRRTGRAEQDEHAEGVYSTEIDVDIAESDRPRPVVLAEIREHLGELKGVSVSLGQPISHRLDHLLSGVRAAIAIKLYGEDLGDLRQQAGRLGQRLQDVPGLVDLQVERQVLIPQVHVQIDREKARRYGVTPGHLAEDLETALGGTRVGFVLEGLRSLDVRVRYAAAARDDIDAIRAVPITLDAGRVVTLGQVADVTPGTGPNQISHENGRRRIVIAANASSERDVGSVVADVEAVLRDADLPDTMTWEIAGQFHAQREATRTIGLLSLFSLAAAYAVLFLHFRSHAVAWQVLLNVPLALVGAVIAMWLAGGTLSVATLVGFVTLTGIASRNTILMISHYAHLIEHEGLAFGPDLVVRGSLERLVPVAMTALCAGIALVPLAFAGGAPGKEILTPVAQVILGGLVSSTLLDLVVTPTVFLRFGGAFAADCAARRSPTGGV